MKEVSAVLPTRVQVLDPVTEDPLDELQDTLVLMQEDELPQGVLELMAGLILRHRPVMETAQAQAWHSQSDSQGTLEIERDEGRSPASAGGSYPQASPLTHKPASHLKPQLFLPSMPQPPVQPMTPAVTLEPALFESPSNSVEPLSVDPVASSRAPAATPLPEAPLNLQATQPAPRAAQSPVPSAVVLPAQAAPEVMREILPGPDRGLLQVPFNSSAASGQVTISRMADEPTRNLLLSPSNAQVFDQIRTALELTREPAWQLTDHGGGQQDKDSHQTPDEEPSEQPTEQQNPPA